MKKVLLATSILAGTAGLASAEIALSGSARMGITYADDGVNTTTAFSSRVRIVFTASGETDGGLAFGASMRADQTAATATTLAVRRPNNGDSTVYISGAFGKLTMGDVSALPTLSLARFRASATARTTGCRKSTSSAPTRPPCTTSTAPAP